MADDSSGTHSLAPLSPGPDISKSGLFASLINISQFFIVAQTGPVSSTVVGHVKTCTIVCIGWIVSGRATGDRALIGVFLAIAAIIASVALALQCPCSPLRLAADAV